MEIKHITFVALCFFYAIVSANGQVINIANDQYHLYGPNSTWGQYLQLGGNGQVTNHAFVAVTNGNLHLDSKVGFGTYINYYNQGNTFINPQGGNVGIGTTFPATKLEVMQTTSGWTMNSRVNAVTAGEINGLKFYSGYIGEDKWAGIASISESLHSNKTGLALFSGMAERLRISGDGNVGIGTTNPTELFNVNGNAQLDRLRLGNANFSGNSRNSINSFNTGQDPNLHTGWIAADFGGSDNASDRLVIGSGFGGRTIIGTHNYNLTQWGGDLIINPTGSKVGIGTYEPKEMLSVNGKIAATEIRVNGAGAPDYVFEKEYELATLAALESYIKANRHLPEMPSAKEFEREGMAVGEMNKLLLKKIEELTLHLIEQNKQLIEQNSKIDNQTLKIAELEKRLKF
ncbi:hypothetical protein [uncultured Pedobacter sp.]|uniref:hypothetical protein n=1 Tax=uncultured Pedobacter sp. TaxID=246139 RepID=UPI0025D81433|nr:hypothetical protein [uncultured Pedobacter sp.]